MEVKNGLYMQDIKKVLGQRVRKLRLLKNISQEKLAELADLHRTYIGSIERGERNVSLENIQKICDALNLSISEFFQDFK